MIFMLFTEAALFAYLLFSYFYFAVQPHEAGQFPQEACRRSGLRCRIRSSSWRRVWLLAGRSLISNMTKPTVDARAGWRRASRDHLPHHQYFEWAEKPFSIASGPYGSLYFTVTGFPHGARGLWA